MRHIAVNFYAAFDSTEWGSREYHYLAPFDDLEFGEILVVYTRNGLSIARFRKYIESENSHAETYVAKRLGMKIITEAAEEVKATQVGILYDNLANLVKKKELLKLAAAHAEEDEQIDAVYRAYLETAGVEPEISIHEPIFEEESYYLEEMNDFEVIEEEEEEEVEEEIEGNPVVIHDEEFIYRYRDETEIITSYYVDNDEDYLYLKQGLISLGASAIGKSKEDSLESLDEGVGVVTFIENIASGYKFFVLNEMKDFSKLPIETTGLASLYQKDKYQEYKTVILRNGRLNVMKEIHNEREAIVFTNELINDNAIFLDISAEDIVSRSYEESSLVSYTTIKATDTPHPLLTTTTFVSSEETIITPESRELVDLSEEVIQLGEEIERLLEDWT